jgi:hypothetical protein
MSVNTDQGQPGQEKQNWPIFLISSLKIFNKIYSRLLELTTEYKAHTTTFHEDAATQHLYLIIKPKICFS